MAKLTASEQLLYSTVHLETSGAAGTFDGTGFFYQATVPGGTVDVVITNKHVMEGCDTIGLRCHQMASRGGPSGHCFNLTVVIAPGGVAYHPDPDVDLCAISMPIQEYAARQGQTVFYVPLSANLLLSAEEWASLDAYEEVLMVGCPNGLYDQTNNVPIFRRGITASHPAMRYNGADEFLIDAACFPGSSGSPVMLFDTVGYLDKDSGNFMLGSKRVKLLGVLYAGPTINQAGEVTLAKNAPVSVTAMMHLGCVLRSSRIAELERELGRMVEAQTS